jgi:hypothetical protein
MVVKNVTLESGYIVVEMDSGAPKRIPISKVLRAADIPTGLTYTQVGAIKTLANLIVILIRTLIDREVLDESFLEKDDISLDAIIETIEEMGGAYHDPDLTVE